MKLSHILFALSLAACGSTASPPAEDAGPADAAPSVAPSVELTGGGHLTGGSLAADVQFTPIHR